MKHLPNTLLSHFHRYVIISWLHADVWRILELEGFTTNSDESPKFDEAPNSNDPAAGTCP